MASPGPRTVTPIIAKIRDFLSMRKVILHTRYETMYSPRTVPPAQLPTGCSHKMSDNYYYTRDGRREGTPGILVVNQSVKSLTAGGQSQVTAIKRAPRPGQVYNWDI